jgi:hypothetical protein
MLKAIIRECLKFKNCFYALSRIVEATGLERQMVRHKLWKLEAAGLITRFKDYEKPLPGFSKGRPKKEIYYRNTKLLKKRIYASSANQNGWDKMWRTTRALKRFTRNDLAIICDQNIENVRCFTKTYRKLGFIQATRKGGRDVLWVFVKYPGSLRPLAGKNGELII